MQGRLLKKSGNEFVGMETFQSHTHEPLDFCPERVEECDAFVLLVAYRYGNIPEGEKISITDLEYEHALKKKIPVRPYIAHPYALQENFTDREQERKMLTDWLTTELHPMLSVIAIGGMGKTALAWYWLMEDILRSDGHPRKIVWWSFYDRESGFGRFLKKAIEYVSGDEVDWNSLKSTRDQMEFLYKILYDNRFLLVLDGVERVLRAYYNLGSPYQGDEIKEDERGDFRACIEPNCGMFLQWLASGNPRTKTLLTSRLFPKELDDLEGVTE